MITSVIANTISTPIGSTISSNTDSTPAIDTANLLYRDNDGLVNALYQDSDGLGQALFSETI